MVLFQFKHKNTSINQIYQLNYDELTKTGDEMKKPEDDLGLFVKSIDKLIKSKQFKKNKVFLSRA